VVDAGTFAGKQLSLAATRHASAVEIGGSGRPEVGCEFTCESQPTPDHQQPTV